MIFQFMIGAIVGTFFAAIFIILGFLSFMLPRFLIANFGLSPELAFFGPFVVFTAIVGGVIAVIPKD